MYLRYVIDPIPRMLAERRAQDIVSRHIEARNKVVHLRRKLQVKKSSEDASHSYIFHFW